MFTEVGRRVELHSTGVGKAMLAQLDPARALAIVRRVGMTGYTEHTITEESVLMADLEQIRERGYAIDEEEQEHGVRCVAVAVPDAIATWSAVSVSGPLTRMTPETVEGAVPLLQRAARELQATAESNPT
jgi:IclR family acetate operon transcriptional repressor